MDVLEAIKSRVSVRKYKNIPIKKEVLSEIVDCARLAPSGYNHQSWVFVVVTDPSIKGSISQAAEWGRFIKDAGACIAVFCKKGEETMVEDACAATENIIIAARAFDLGTCWVNSYKKSHSENVKSILKCPPEYELITLLAVGYYDKQKSPPKKPLEEVIRWDGF
jgi:nitroreductase